MASYGSTRYVRLEQIERYLTSGSGPKLVFIETNFVEQFRYPNWKEALDFRSNTINAQYDLERLSVTNVELTAPLLHALEELNYQKNGLVLNGIRLQPENIAKAILFFRNKEKLDLTGQLFTFDHCLPQILIDFRGELNIYRTTLSISVNHLCCTFLCCNLITVNIHNIRFNSFVFEKRLLKALQESMTIRKLSYDCRKKTPILLGCSDNESYRLSSVSFGLEVDNVGDEAISLRPMINYVLRSGCCALFDNVHIGGYEKLKQLSMRLSRHDTVKIYVLGNQERVVNLDGISEVEIIDELIHLLQIVPTA